jgi:hypothetical protein
MDNGGKPPSLAADRLVKAATSRRTPNGAAACEIIVFQNDARSQKVHSPETDFSQSL